MPIAKLAGTPGTSVISRVPSPDNFDGSDLQLVVSTISFSPSGTDYSIVDTGSILFGSPLESVDETEPWTLIGQIGGPAITPGPASMVLFGRDTSELRACCAKKMRVLAAS